MASGVGAGAGPEMGPGGDAGGNTGGKIAGDVGAGEASEIATSGGSGTGAGGTIRSSAGAGADVDGDARFAVDKEDKTEAGDGEIRSAGLSDSAWTEGRVVVGDGRAEGATPAVVRSGDSV